MIRYKNFMLSDYPEEEKWLREMAAQGYILKKLPKFPGFYQFEEEGPKDMVYRFDFISSPRELRECMVHYAENDWEYLGNNNDFILFAKEAEGKDPDAVNLFSSKEAKDRMVERILQKRMVPVFMLLCLMILLTGVLILRHHSTDSIVISVVCTIIVALIDLRCYLGLKKLKKRL